MESNEGSRTYTEKAPYRRYSIVKEHSARRRALRRRAGNPGFPIETPESACLASRRSRLSVTARRLRTVPARSAGLRRRRSGLGCWFPRSLRFRRARRHGSAETGVAEEAALEKRIAACRPLNAPETQAIAPQSPPAFLQDSLLMSGSRAGIGSIRSAILAVFSGTNRPMPK